MQSIAQMLHTVWCICLRVCLLVVTVSIAKMAEAIVMLVGMLT